MKRSQWLNHSFLFVLVLVASLFTVLLAPNPAFAGADQKFDTVSEDTVIRSMKKLAETREQNLILATVQFALKTRLFPALSAAADRNPNFKVGTFPFALFMRNIEKVQLATLTAKEPLQADANRVDDFYVLNGYIGVVNPSAVQGSSRSLGLLFTHILLGAEGFDDNDYQISIALAIADLKLRLPSSSPLAEVDIASLLSSPSYSRQSPTFIPRNSSGNYVIASNGGFTGVGGGGDTTSIEMKLSLLEELALRFTYFKHNQCGGRWETATDYVRSILNASIESKPGISKTDYVVSGIKVTVFIPRASTRQSSISDSLVIETMASICVIEAQK